VSVNLASYHHLCFKQAVMCCAGCKSHHKNKQNLHTCANKTNRLVLKACISGNGQRMAFDSANSLRRSLYLLAHCHQVAGRYGNSPISLAAISVTCFGLVIRNYSDILMDGRQLTRRLPACDSRTSLSEGEDNHIYATANTFFCSCNDPPHCMPHEAARLTLA
jgi:hypothetical protein